VTGDASVLSIGLAPRLMDHPVLACLALSQSVRFDGSPRTEFQEFDSSDEDLFSFLLVSPCCSLVIQSSGNSFHFGVMSFMGDFRAFSRQVGLTLKMARIGLCFRIRCVSCDSQACQACISPLKTASLSKWKSAIAHSSESPICIFRDFF
jgi:hypothetical protein